MRGREFWFVLYLISVAFILSGAFNYGFSRFWFAMPFMALAVWIGAKRFSSRKFMAATLLYCVAAIVFNLSLEKNPWVFPILQNGEVVIEQDGELEIHADESVSFLTQEDKKHPIGCSGCGPTTLRKVSKGEHFKVVGISISHPEFGTEVSAVTEVGRFSAFLAIVHNPQVISFTKKLEISPFRDFGLLMLYPALPILLSSLPSVILKSH